MGDANRIPSMHKANCTELFRSLESSLESSFSSESLRPEPNSLIIVICGPSGVGKDALIQRLRDSRRNLHFVITAITRPKRPTEVHGQDYYFVSKEEFLSMVEGDGLLEYALVYGDYKGVPKQQIRSESSWQRCLFSGGRGEAAMVKRLVDRKTDAGEEACEDSDGEGGDEAREEF
ncbi:Guanylate kinase 2/mitochondrial [Arachis hypogaea]|nr:Guanylate kinase 2/mitochondrial [Arachis hypogaea]